MKAIAGTPPQLAVWKMFPELALRMALHRNLRRVTAYLSLTGRVSTPVDPQVRSHVQPPAQWQRLMPMASKETLGSGIHFVGGEDLDREVACVVRAWPIHGDIWEVGGLFTAPDSRGRGWATRVVRMAVTHLGDRGLRTRYVVREDNAASLAVARRVGLREYSRLEYWIPAERPHSAAPVWLLNWHLLAHARHGPWGGPV